MEAARPEPVLDHELSVFGLSFGPVDLPTFMAVRLCMLDVDVPAELCATFLRRLADRVDDREEWVRTIRLLLCSMAEIGCDSAYFDSVLAAQLETADGATVALAEARRIGAEFGFDWLEHPGDGYRSTAAHHVAAA